MDILWTNKGSEPYKDDWTYPQRSDRIPHNGTMLRSQCTRGITGETQTKAWVGARRTYNIIEVSGEVLFRNTRSVKDSSEDVRRPHSDDIPEHHREDGVVESIENIDMNQQKNSVTSHDGETACSNGSIFGLSTHQQRSSRLPELGCRHYTDITDINEDYDSEVNPQCLRVAVECVVDDRNIGAWNQNANSTIVDCLENIGYDETRTVVLMVDGTSSHTPNGTSDEHNDRPARHMTNDLMIELSQVGPKILRDLDRLLNIREVRIVWIALNPSQQILVKRAKCGHYRRNRVGRQRRNAVASIPRKEWSGSIADVADIFLRLWCGKIIEKCWKVFCDTLVTRQHIYASCVHWFILTNDIGEVSRGALRHCVCHHNVLAKREHVLNGNRIG